MSKLRFGNSLVPVLLLLATTAAFGLLIPRLGFYWDDWPVLYLTQTQGSGGFWDFYQYDRPFSAWTYILLAPILGTNSLAWFLLVLGLRWLSAVFIWLSIKTIWPGKDEQAFWAALLFAVCPLFTQQQVVVAYSQHWMSLLFYLISLYCMLIALERRRSFYAFAGLAITLELIQLFTMEYFVGLELLRPVLLWIYFCERNPESSKKSAFWFTVRNYSGYFAALIVYVIWRLFFLNLPDEAINRPVLLSELAQSPVRTALGLLERVLQDVYYMLVSWIAAVNPLDFDFNRPFALVALIISILTAVGFGVFLHLYRSPDPEGEHHRWGLGLLLLGVLAVILGALPVWMIGRQVTLGGDRFTFASMLGVCMVFVGLLEWLSSQRGAKIAMIAVMLGLAVHTNLFLARSYQQSWEQQRSFYWQLFWRAPYIQPGTPFISDGEIFSYVGLYSTAMGISLLYPPVDIPQQVPYWFFNYYEGTSNALEKNDPTINLRYTVRDHSFRGQVTDSLFVSFNPQSYECLQVYSSSDTHIKKIPPVFQPYLKFSNLTQIENQAPTADWRPPQNIFGREPEHTWCYYFQKADLARQNEDWEEIVSLYEEANSQGHSPRDARDLLLFMDALLRISRFDEAYDLSVVVNSASKSNHGAVCTFWSGYDELLVSDDFKAVHEKAVTKFAC